jgi:5-methylthioadenosine/S-adenosylhomocysteine deaminase
LDEKTLLVHGVHLTDEELGLSAERRAGLALCVESNMKLASGQAPVPRMIQHGLRPGLGTDGAASNNDLNMFSEMRLTALSHKLTSNDPTALPAEQVLGLATVGSADALGWPDGGRIETGALADLIVLDVMQPHLIPWYSAASQLVYAAYGSEVEYAVVGGRVLVDRGELTTIDLEEASARVRELTGRILGRS